MSLAGKPGYKETDVGWLPLKWKVRRLSALTKSYAGGTPDRSRPEYFDGDIPWVKSGEVNHRKITTTEECISERALAESSAKVAERGAVLVAMYGATAGKVARLQIDAAISQAVLSIRSLGDELDNEFLFWVMESSAEKLLSMCQGAAQPNLSKGLIDGLAVAIPPLPEQQKIAAILTAVDDILDVTTRLIAATQTLRQGLMQTLFSRGVGTQDAAGRWVPHTEFKESELGQIPLGWEIRSLESVANVERGKFSARPRNDPKYFEAGDIPFIQTGDVASTARFIESASQFLNMEGLGVSKLFPVGTIFITIAANIGDVAIAKMPMACPDSVVGIKANGDICDSVWLYYLLNSSKDYFVSRATQNAQKNINLQVLKPFLFALPPMPEQRRIADILTTLDDKLDVLAFKKAHYQTLKRGLMQKLLTGEWRVKLDTPVEEVMA